MTTTSPESREERTRASIYASPTVPPVTAAMEKNVNETDAAMGSSQSAYRSHDHDDDYDEDDGDCIVNFERGSKYESATLSAQLI